MKERIMEVIIEVEDVVIELRDRANGDFDHMLADKLNDAVKLLEKMYNEVSPSHA
jgi:hypothetical protein